MITTAHALDTTAPAALPAKPPPPPVRPPARPPAQPYCATCHQPNSGHVDLAVALPIIGAVLILLAVAVALMIRADRRP